MTKTFIFMYSISVLRHIKQFLQECPNKPLTFFFFVWFFLKKSMKGSSRNFTLWDTVGAINCLYFFACAKVISRKCKYCSVKIVRILSINISNFQCIIARTQTISESTSATKYPVTIRKIQKKVIQCMHAQFDF